MDGTTAAFSEIVIAPKVENVLSSMTAVALVGPKAINFEPLNNIPRIEAKADPNKPYSTGNPAIIAIAIPWGNANKATFIPAKASLFNNPALYPEKARLTGKKSNWLCRVSLPNHPIIPPLRLDASSSTLEKDDSYRESKTTSTLRNWGLKRESHMCLEILVSIRLEVLPTADAAQYFWNPDFWIISSPLHPEEVDNENMPGQ
jgi:hypothetical protein